MAALALGLAGAAAGSFLGFGSVGASVGWLVGSTLGNMLFGSSQGGQKITQEGTRLTDLKVQTSTYGNMIPVVYGVIRVSGNVIWATDIVETRHEDTVEQDGGGMGKGGPPSVEQTSVTYTYAANIAVGLCEGEIAGVRRIWANGKLIYDIGDSNFTLVSSFGVTGGGSLRVYPGNETQTPDGLIQAHQGVNNTPAFRGLAYVVFENFQLADFGNQIPNLTFEVVKQGFYHTQGIRVATSGAAGMSFAVIMYNPTDNDVYVANPGNGDIFRISLATNTVVATGNSSHLVGIIAWLYNPVNSKIYAWTPSAFYEVDPTTFLTKFAWDALAFSGIGGDANQFLNIVDTQVERLYGSYITLSMGTITSRLNVMDATNPSNDNAIFQYQWGGNDVSLRILDPATGYLWGDNSDGSSATPSKFANWDVRSGSGQPAYVFDVPNTNLNRANAMAMMIDHASRRLMAYYNGNSSNGYICIIDLDTQTIVSTTQVPVANGGNNPLFNTQERHVFYISAGNKIVHFDVDTATYTQDNYPFSGISDIVSSAYDPNTDSELWGGRDSVTGTGLFRNLGLRLTPDPHSLASIVEDLCTRVNLTSSDLNLSLLDGSVDGYFISNISTVRACLQQLMQAFYFDATESDYKIKFVPRGQASALTIDADNLGAYTYSDTPPDIITITRAQDLDLPREVSVVYFNKNQNYEQGTQYSRRIDKENKKVETVTFPIAMDDTKGKAVADVLLYDFWVGRTTYEFMTTLAYSALEPTDVITVTNGSATYSIRIVTKEQDAGLIKFTGVDEVPAIYTQDSPGAPSIDPNNTIYFPSPTRLFFLDIPCLRDADNNPGVYIGASPSNPNAPWRGSQILRSVDNGNSYQEVTSFFGASTSGMASTVLGNWTGGNQFDFKNTVTIMMISGELADVSELQAFNGFNLALLGDEIIIFRDVELISTGVYKLSCLLRGRFGTEQYMSTHVAPERFIMLNNAVHRYNETVNDINSTYLYRPITFGNDLFSAPNIPLQDTGVCLKPLTAVHIKGSRNVSLDILIDWVRRTRITGGWNDYADVPIGEATEAYQVDIYNGSDVVRTIDSTTPSVTYTAAQQVADFGSTQSSVDIVIYQMSEIVGRGFGAAATV